MRIGSRLWRAVQSALSMRYPVHLSLLVLLLLAAAVVPADAQTDTATLNASINGLARLSLSTFTVSFPDADPDTVPNIPASQGPVTITAKARTSVNGGVTLTVLATDQLRSGLNTIPASNITWTVSGSGFSNGTLSAASAQTVAGWTGSGVRTGTQSFFFKNLWSYATGTYTLTMTFTLSAA
jgi:hypothetical protein